MDPKVAVIVVNWNGRAFLERCLTSVETQTYRDREVILVDNGSIDGSVEYVAKRFRQVKLLVNPTNLGFAAANNQAIMATTADFIALLNNDAYAEPAWLENLVFAMESDPGVGSCASKILLASPEGVLDSAGIDVDVTALAWGRGGGCPEQEAIESQPVEVFGASGGAALYRRAMLAEIGFFDPDFFAYLEDVDLAWRARLSGWRCLYVPSAKVYHVHSGTTGRDSSFKIRLLGRNKVWMILKNYPMPQLLCYLGPILLYDALALGYRLVRQGDLAALGGRLESLAATPKVWRGRRAVMARRRVSFQEIGLRGLASPSQVLKRYRSPGIADGYRQEQPLD